MITSNKIKLFSLIIILLTILGFYLFKEKTINSKTSEKNKKEVVEKKYGKKVKLDLKLPERFFIGIFATGLGEARDLEFSPEGILLVSDHRGRVLAMPDINKDGIADKVITLLEGLQRPHGLTFYKNKLYLAEETKVTRYDWVNGRLVNPQRILDLPSGGRHRSRTIEFDNDGLMYISIGSFCNACFEDNPWLSSVISANADGTNPQVYSSGLRNAVFITLNPKTNQLWATEMGRDYIGDDLPPDEINILQENGNYGWPVCYGNKIYDKNLGEKDETYCQDTIAAVHDIPAHSAPLGLTFINSLLFPPEWQGDLLVSYHGSSHSSVPKGYKIVRMDVENNKIISESDFLTGFIQGKEVLGRPVDLVFDNDGYLYLSHDKGGLIYIIGR